MLKMLLLSYRRRRYRRGTSTVKFVRSPCKDLPGSRSYAVTSACVGFDASKTSDLIMTIREVKTSKKTERYWNTPPPPGREFFLWGSFCFIVLLCQRPVCAFRSSSTRSSISWVQMSELRSAFSRSSTSPRNHESGRCPAFSMLSGAFVAHFARPVLGCMKKKEKCHRCWERNSRRSSCWCTFFLRFVFAVALLSRWTCRFIKAYSRRSEEKHRRGFWNATRRDLTIHITITITYNHNPSRVTLKSPRNQQHSWTQVDAEEARARTGPLLPDGSRPQRVQFFFVFPCTCKFVDQGKLHLSRSGGIILPNFAKFRSK